VSNDTDDDENDRERDADHLRGEREQPRPRGSLGEAGRNALRERIVLLNADHLRGYLIDRTIDVITRMFDHRRPP
jgi:hypothetical protein